MKKRIADIIQLPFSHALNVCDYLRIHREGPAPVGQPALGLAPASVFNGLLNIILFIGIRDLRIAEKSFLNGFFKGNPVGARLGNTGYLKVFFQVLSSFGFAHVRTQIDNLFNDCILIIHNVNFKSNI